MSPRTRPDDEMVQAEALPQADASSLVDAERARGRGQGDVPPRRAGGGGRASLRGGPRPRRAPRLSTRAPRRDPGRGAGVVRGRRLPPRSCGARTRRGRCSTSARAPAPTSSALRFRSASPGASSASTSPMSRSERRRASETGTASPQVEFVEAHIDELPFEDESFDAVISNGVINLSPVKGRVFAEAARVLRPGGRLAIADIVSGRPLKERTRRNVELWAACIAGAIPRRSYVETIEAAGLDVARGAPERLPLHLRPGARGVQHLRGRERLAVGGEGALVCALPQGEAARSSCRAARSPLRSAPSMRPCQSPAVCSPAK